MKNKELLAGGLLLLFFVFFFSGCASLDALMTAPSQDSDVSSQDSDVSSQDSDVSSHLISYQCLEKVGSFGSFEVWREKVTDVLYLMRSTNRVSAAGIGFTVMYHPDGSPLLYSEWIEMMEED